MQWAVSHIPRVAQVIHGLIRVRVIARRARTPLPQDRAWAFFSIEEKVSTTTHRGGQRTTIASATDGREGLSNPAVDVSLLLSGEHKSWPGQNAKVAQGAPSHNDDDKRGWSSRHVSSALGRGMGVKVA
jgi:hypothetical protein